MHKSKLGGFIIDCQTNDLDGAAHFWGAALGMPVRELPGSEGVLQATRGFSLRLGHRGAEGGPRQPRAPRYRNRRYRRRGPPAGKIGRQAGTGRPYLVGHGGAHRAAILRGTRDFKVVRRTSHTVDRVGIVQSLRIGNSNHPSGPSLPTTPVTSRLRCPHTITLRRT
jgi:hypothetical protein